MKSTGTCATNQYIKQINADGSVVCGNVPYHWGVTCSAGQYIERINSDGTPTCRTITSLVNNVDCPVNQFIYRHANGSFSCRGYTDSNVFGKACSSGQSLRGFDGSGNPICDTTGAGTPCTVSSWWWGQSQTYQHGQVFRNDNGCSCGGDVAHQCWNGTSLYISGQCYSCGN